MLCYHIGMLFSRNRLYSVAKRVFVRAKRFVCQALPHKDIVLKTTHGLNMCRNIFVYYIKSLAV